MNDHRLILFGLIYLLLDAIWLYTMTTPFYRPRFERIQQTRLTFKMAYAIAAYVLLLFTMVFVCIPLVRVYPKVHPSLVFAMVGLSIYGVYNMTNGAVFDDYGVDLCMVDTAWGLSSFAFMGWLYGRMESS